MLRQTEAGGSLPDRYITQCRIRVRAHRLIMNCRKHCVTVGGSEDGAHALPHLCPTAPQQLLGMKSVANILWSPVLPASQKGASPAQMPARRAAPSTRQR